MLTSETPNNRSVHEEADYSPQSGSTPTLQPSDLSTDFSQEQNYSAFQLFREIDSASSGYITAIQLRNFLYGDSRQFFNVKFDYADTGLIWISIDGNIYVKDFEKNSPSSTHPEIMQGLQLRAINGRQINGDIESLYSKLLSIQDDNIPIVFTFYVPLLVIYSFNQNLDFEINHKIYEVLLPVGAVNNLITFEGSVNNSLRHILKSQLIRMTVNPSNRSFSFSSTKTRFRLLFSRQRSCCYILGFPPHNSSDDFQHIGDSLTTNISLEESIECINLLVSHLLYVLNITPNHMEEDTIQPPESTIRLTFEQFRILFVNFFSDQIKLAALKKYANKHFKLFCRKVHYCYMMQMRRDRYTRKEEILRTNGDIMAEQLARMSGYVSDRDGLGRKHVGTGGRRSSVVAEGKMKSSEKKKKKRSRTTLADEESLIAALTTSSVKLGEVLVASAYHFRKYLQLSGRASNPDGYYSAQEKAVYVWLWKHLCRSDRLIAEAGQISEAILEESRGIVRTPTLQLSPVKFIDDQPIGHMGLSRFDSKAVHPSTSTYFMVRESSVPDALTCHPAFFGAMFIREPNRHSSACVSAAQRLSDDCGKNSVLMYTPAALDDDVSLLSSGVSKLSPSLADISSFSDSKLSDLRALASKSIISMSAYASEFERLRNLEGSIFSPSANYGDEETATHNIGSDHSISTCLSAERLAEKAFQSHFDRPKTSRGLGLHRPDSSQCKVEEINGSYLNEDYTNNNCRCYQEVPENIREVALKVVDSMIDSVCSSFVAMQTGADFLDSLISDVTRLEERLSADTESYDNFDANTHPSMNISFQSFRYRNSSSFIQKKKLLSSGRVCAANNHVSEWRSYPPTPIFIGVNKRQHRIIARSYDKQMLIHPAFFGFSVRWKQDNDIITESRYVNPAFSGYLFNKTGISSEEREILRLESLRARSKNPYKWSKPTDKSRCLICGNGIAGCPRCFVLPTLKDGTPSLKRDFEFDPRTNFKGDRLLLGIRRVPSFHTNLTTYKALRLYRPLYSIFVTVLIKEMPGKVHRLIVDANYTTFNLWNMMDAHSYTIARSPSRMLVLPTLNAIFPLHNEVTFDDEMNLGITTGNIPLCRYGICSKNTTVAILAFSQYAPHLCVSIVTSYLRKNSNLASLLSSTQIENNLENLPRDLITDDAQVVLVPILQKQFEKENG